MTPTVSDKMHTSSITLFIAHHVWHNKVQPPMARQNICCKNSNNSGTHLIWLRVLSCAHNHGDRTPTIRNTEKKKILLSMSTCRWFQSTATTAFLLSNLLPPSTTAKNETPHTRQICRFSKLVQPIRTHQVRWSFRVGARLCNLQNLRHFIITLFDLLVFFLFFFLFFFFFEPKDRWIMKCITRSWSNRQWDIHFFKFSEGWNCHSTHCQHWKILSFLLHFFLFCFFLYSCFLTFSLFLFSLCFSSKGFSSLSCTSFHMKVLNGVKMCHCILEQLSNSFIHVCTTDKLTFLLYTVCMILLALSFLLCLLFTSPSQIPCCLQKALWIPFLGNLNTPSEIASSKLHHSSKVRFITSCRSILSKQNCSCKSILW